MQNIIKKYKIRFYKLEEMENINLVIILKINKNN